MPQLRHVPMRVLYEVQARSKPEAGAPNVARVDMDQWPDKHNMQHGMSQVIWAAEFKAAAKMNQTKSNDWPPNPARLGCSLAGATN